MDPPICLPSYSGWSIREVSAEIQAFFEDYASSTVWKFQSHSCQECYQRWSGLTDLRNRGFSSNDSKLRSLPKNPWGSLPKKRFNSSHFLLPLQMKTWRKKKRILSGKFYNIVMTNQTENIQSKIFRNWNWYQHQPHDRQAYPPRTDRACQGW